MTGCCLTTACIACCLTTACIEPSARRCSWRTWCINTYRNHAEHHALLDECATRLRLGPQGIEQHSEGFFLQIWHVRAQQLHKCVILRSLLSGVCNLERLYTIIASKIINHCAP